MVYNRMKCVGKSVKVKNGKTYEKNDKQEKQQKHTIN